jgi:hypothetical protein
MIRRVEVHDRFGGGRQGGIAPSRISPNVMIFSDPDVGAHHGYHDRWEGNEYHYVGEGQSGDQEMVRGNAAILRHREDGRALRLFWGVRRVVEYAGEFQVAPTGPWYTARARETGSERQRNVITFRLVPMGSVDPPGEGPNPGRKIVRPAPPALSVGYRPASETGAATPRDPFVVDPDVVDRGLVGHASTQNALAAAVESAGLEPLSPGPRDPDFDLAWIDRHGRCIVVEVKSLTRANESKQLRLGLGQVLDYADSLRDDGRNVLPVLAVEKEPVERRWLRVCETVGVQLVWPELFSKVVA